MNKLCPFGKVSRKCDYEPPTGDDQLFAKLIFEVLGASLPEYFSKELNASWYRRNNNDHNSRANHVFETDDGSSRDVSIGWNLTPVVRGVASRPRCWGGVGWRLVMAVIVYARRVS